jgi:hypothetical protein
MLFKNLMPNSRQYNQLSTKKAPGAAWSALQGSGHFVQLFSGMIPEAEMLFHKTEMFQPVNAPFSVKTHWR